MVFVVVVAIRVSIDWFSSYRAHPHMHIFCPNDSVYITCRECVSCTVNPLNLLYILTHMFVVVSFVAWPILV